MKAEDNGEMAFRIISHTDCIFLVVVVYEHFAIEINVIHFLVGMLMCCYAAAAAAAAKETFIVVYVKKFTVSK